MPKTTQWTLSINAADSGSADEIGTSGQNSGIHNSGAANAAVWTLGGDSAIYNTGTVDDLLKVVDGMMSVNQETNG